MTVYNTQDYWVFSTFPSSGRMLVTNSMNKNIRDLYRGINEFKWGYQPRSNLVKDEDGDLCADSHNILNV
jgi:hypothetical protein